MVYLYIITHVSWLIWAAVVIGNISQSRNWVNASTQGSKQKNNKKTWRLVFRWKLTEDEILKCTNRWRTMNYIHSNIFILLPPALSTSDTRYLFFKMSTIDIGFSAIICKMLPQILIITKKYKFPCSAVNVHVIIRLFISFPVKHTANFRFDGRHCICDLMANAMVRKLLYSEFDSFYSSIGM